LIYGTRRIQKMKHPRLVVLAAVFVLAALVLTVSGCELDGEVKEYRDPATVIEVEKGEEFAIVLGSNPSTGYQWKLAEELDAEIIVLVKTEYEEPDTELIGAAGEEKWTFKAEGLGSTSITLAYVRPWEEEDTQEPVVMEEEGGPGEGEEAGETEATKETEETEVEEGPDTVTFDVRVKKAGSMDKEPKKYDNPDETIEAEVGLEFALVLESNPTTGYSWRLAEPLDEDIVELVSSEFAKKTPADGEGEIVGAPGEEVWTFEAIGEGKTEIKLEYVRPWETDVAPEETKTFEVEVKSAEEAAE
jgi:inhibitor of cysteine peptidase